jgi:response regulator of citrate/malate metabolism
MLTVEARKSVIQEALDHKVIDYLIKPIKSKELKERIGKQLEDEQTENI